MASFSEAAFDSDAFDPDAFDLGTSTWTEAGFSGGWAVNSDGIAGTIFLDDVTPVPGGAIRLNGFAYSAQGMRYVCAFPGDSIVEYQIGISRRPDGATCIEAAGTGAGYSGGITVTSLGEILVSTGSPVTYIAGIGFDVDDRLCVTELS